MSVQRVYLNGEYLDKGEASISVDDRGFLLADGVYEVTAAYHGAFFRLDRHLSRMENGLAAIGMELDVNFMTEVHHRLLRENGLVDAPTAKVYIQVTRGAAPRSHAFPVPTPPSTVFAAADPMKLAADDRWLRGFSAITVPDRRWSRVDIKSIALLPNVLAEQAAVDAGADEAIQVRDGVAIEGAHANLFAVFDGVLTTHPESNRILPGITRAAVLELAADRGTPVKERPIPAEELSVANEVFLTGTTVEVRPITQIDGQPIGSGIPGPLARELQAAYRMLVGHDA